MLRSLGKKGPEFCELGSAEEEALQPPSQALCDAAVAELREYERTLDELAQHVPDERERAYVDYRRALVEAASPEELTWLKLKAYYRGLDALRASQGEVAYGDAIAPAVSTSAGSASEQPAPSSSPSSFPERDAVLQAVSQLLPSSSSEEEDQDSTAEPSSWTQRLASHAAAAPAPAAPHAASASAVLAPEEAGAKAAAATAVSWPGTVYNASYLEEQELSRRVARQRRQRSQAFMLSLAVALGASVVRWWLRRERGKGAAEPAGEPSTTETEAPLAQ